MRSFREASIQRRAMLLFGGLAFVIGVVLLTVAGISTLGGGDSEPDIELRDLGNTPVVVQTDTPTPPPTEEPTEEPTPEPTPVPEPPLPAGDYTMIIETLGVNAPVRTYGLDENAVPVVPTGSDAADVVAWYDFSAQPGTGGNAVFAGHVTWFGPGVFISLPSLQAGDEIRLVGNDGTELVYLVSDVFHVDPSDPDSVRVMHPTDEEVLTIITCDGDFIDTDDPVLGGEYTLRLVVQARPAGSTAVAAGAGG